MTAKYDWIRNYYVKGLYTLENLDTFVRANWITEAEKNEIIQYKTEIIEAMRIRNEINEGVEPIV